MVIRTCIQESFPSKITSMKYHPSCIVILMLLGIWGCSDIGDSSCSETVDCDGECGGLAVEDCAGVCNGSAIENEDNGNCTNISYSLTIQPIFTANCTNCHGGQNELILTSYDKLMEGGFSGDVIGVSGDVIDPDAHVSSLLWQYIDDGFMPFSAVLTSENDLTEAQISIIADWIDEGAFEIPQNK